jgi:WD40 repeat protein
LARLFISHSSKDSVAALAFKQWLGSNGWAKTDVFLDVDDIGAGEIWKEALRKSKLRCEAIILLATPEALDSPECLAELRTAEDYGKEIIVVLLRDLTVGDARLASYRARQIVDLSARPQAHTEQVEFLGDRYDVHFNNEALVKVRDYLFRRGITPDSFTWPPENRPDADPFPGLSAFTEDDAGIFFGRDTDILKGLDKLRRMRRDRSPRIIAIQAASGAGKSSFLRAGLWPRLCRDPDYAPLAILRPAGGILTGPEGLGRKLAPRLSRPGAPVNPGDVYTRLSADDAATTISQFAGLMTHAAVQANEERRIANPEAPPPALLVAIDQAEELLTLEDAAENNRFLDLLAGLSQSPPEGVEPIALLTVRLDDAPRLFRAFADRGLEPPETLMLLPVPQTSFRDIIRKPIEVAARRGQQITISPPLVDELVGEATGADALPLLAFTLSFLYQSFAPGGTITLEQYKAIGGMAGSIDKAVKQALARPGDEPAIPAAPAEQLSCLRATFIPALATVDLDSAQPKRRVAKRDEFLGATRSMVDRLVKARLLVVDQQDGADTIEVAHESLLRQWPALAEWLHAESEKLAVIASVERAAGEWDRNGRLPAWLDHRGDRLNAADRVAAQEDFRRRLGAIGMAYLEACRRRETRQRRIMQAVGWGVAAVTAAFMVVFFILWQNTLQAKKETEASLLVAKSELDRGSGNVAAAAAEAAQAYRSMPNVQTRSALLQAAMEISPHQRFVLPLGGAVAEALAWWSGNRIELATDTGTASMDSGRLETLELADGVKPAGSFARPLLTRSQEGNPAHIRALAPLADERMMAVFDTGAIGVYRAGSNTVEWHASDLGTSVNATQSSIAVSPGGTLIALVTTDNTILLYRCNWSASAPACAADRFGDVHGRAVAISPDDQRIAIGDQDGNIAVYDLSANPIGMTQKFGAPINALGWAAQRDWLAVGTLAGEIAVLDTSADAKPIVARQTFGNQSVAALDWSAKEPALAFVCNSEAVCLWRLPARPAPGSVFRPAVRLEGHRQLITNVSFDPSGSALATAAADHTVRIWSLQQNSDVSSTIYAEEDGQLDRLAVSPDHHWLAGGTSGGGVEIWDAQSGASARAGNVSPGFAVQDLAWDHSGRLADLDEDGAIRVMASDPGKDALALHITRSPGRHLAWADSDRVLALPLSASGLILLDPQSPNVEPVWLGPRDKQAWSVATMNAGRSLLVSYVDGTVIVWDLASKQPIGAPLRNPQAAQTSRIGIGSLSISPDQRLLATSGGDRVVTIYDLGTHSVSQALQTQSSAGTQTVAFSPDGRKLAALGNDNRLYVWTIGRAGAEPYLAVGFVPRRAIVGDAPDGSGHAGWLGWLDNNRIAVATGIAAISTIAVDPAKWLARLDTLAVGAQAPLQ